MKSICWLILVGLLFGCGGEVTPTATAVSTQPPTAETVAETEVDPTNTAVPAERTATPPAATLPPRPPQPTAVPSPAPATVPALVWLPYATGNFGQPVLMVEDGEMAPRPMPVEVELFFDYHDGWLAYGSQFWEPTANQQSVTELRLYSFATGEETVWAELVGRAAISPLGMLGEPPAVAAASHNGQGFDLILLRGAENQTMLVEDIDPYFSWSPDGRLIAYLRNNELFVTDAAAPSGSPPIASGVYASSGWIGDAPLWLGDSGYLLYADAPFIIVAVDGSETIVPQDENGTELPGQRPYTMLYSTTTNQLIAEFEGMFGTNVAVYQFEDRFATAELVEQIDDAQLAGWYVANESVVIVSGGEPTILSLTRQE